LKDTEEKLDLQNALKGSNLGYEETVEHVQAIVKVPAPMP
jgi:hypothetical protein